MSYDGNWTITLHTPVGDQAFRLEAQVEGARLTGTVKSDTDTTEISNGKVDGNHASWDFSITKPIALTLNFTAERNGDTISGTAKLGMFGNGKFEGTRAG
jgi:hypothetical protein